AWPSRARSLPLATSHRLTDSSAISVARTRPSGEKEQLTTVTDDSILRMALPVLTSIRLIVPFDRLRPLTGAGANAAGDASPAEARSLPSCGKISPAPEPPRDRARAAATG